MTTSAQASLRYQISRYVCMKLAINILSDGQEYRATFVDGRIVKKNYFQVPAIHVCYQYNDCRQNFLI